MDCRVNNCRNLFEKALRLVGNKWFILLINTVFFVIMALVLPIHFETNDDVAMCQIANGRFSGNPDGHLIWINALLGWVLAGLYSITDVVEWYTLTLCIFHVLAITAIVYFVINDTCIHWLIRISTVLFLYVLWIRIIVGFQFTTTAGIMCCSGSMALLKSNKWCRVYGLVAILIALLIRFESAGMVGLMFAPLFMLEVLKDKRFVFWLVAAFALVFLSRLMDGLFYQSTEWKEYTEYNKLRGSILDSPFCDEAFHSLPEGINFEDYELFVGFEGDPSVFTMEKLRLIESVVNKDATTVSMQSVVSRLTKYRVPLLFVCLGCFVCFFMNSKQKRKSEAWVVLAEFLLFWSVMLGVSINLYVKDRVFLCMLLPIVYTMVVLLPEMKKTTLVLPLFAMCGLIGGYLFKDYKYIGGVHDGIEYVNSYQIPLVKERKEKVFSIEFWEQFLPPFGIKDVKCQVRGLGWSAMSPLNKGILESYLDFVDSEWVFFTQVDDPPIKIANAIDRHYGISLDVELIDSNEKYALYKFVSKIE